MKTDGDQHMPTVRWLPCSVVPIPDEEGDTFLLAEKNSRSCLHILCVKNLMDLASTNTDDDAKSVYIKFVYMRLGAWETLLRSMDDISERCWWAPIPAKFSVDLRDLNCEPQGGPGDLSEMNGFRIPGVNHPTGKED